MVSIVTWCILLWSIPTVAQPTSGELEQVRAGLERILRENIVPFWQEQAIDAEQGGYRLHHDGDGTWLGAADKALVTQARTLWFFSRLYGSIYGSPEHLRLAQHGYVFLRDALQDKDFGGFFWAVSADGNVATKPHKHLYGQAFALYALAEYARASGDGQALQLADDLFYLLEERAHDATYGGYVEWFRRDWQNGPQTGQYMGTEPDGKLMNTHLHLLEALTTYWEVSGDELARERLIELMFVQTNAVVRKNTGACTDRYRRDWTPLLDPPYDRVSYGHDVENTWLVAAAARSVGVPNGPLMDLYRQLVDSALNYGFDRDNGGFYSSGVRGMPADELTKVWWVQAEGLVALLALYNATGSTDYWDAFMATYRWIVARQVDWTHGDWHAQVAADGRVTGSKANAWKSPYHNGRAILECLQLLEAIAPSKDRH